MRFYSLDNYNLNTPPLSVVDSDVDSSPMSKLNIKPRANADGSRVLSNFLAHRRINLNMRISGSTFAEAGQALDILKRIQSKGEVSFIAEFPEGNRRWNVYVRHIPTKKKSVDVSRMSNNMVLIAEDPVSQSLTEEHLMPDRVATTPFEQQVFYMGTWRALPVIKLTYSHVTPQSRPYCGSDRQ